MWCGFKVGYFSERINSGDKIQCLENIYKIVSSIDEYSLETIKKIYNLVIGVGINPVTCEHLKLLRLLKTVNVI